tara:strand:+ start:518 stop:754 length:237 start_codon:yes stop_codon:yes gene_type:complete
MENPITQNYRTNMTGKELFSWSNEALDELKLKLIEGSGDSEELYDLLVIDSLINQYNPNMPEDANHSWAQKVVTVLNQ